MDGKDSKVALAHQGPDTNAAGHKHSKATSCSKRGHLGHNVSEQRSAQLLLPRGGLNSSQHPLHCRPPDSCPLSRGQLRRSKLKSACPTQRSIESAAKQPASNLCKHDWIKISRLAGALRAVLPTDYERRWKTFMKNLRLNVREFLLAEFSW